jgi:hypothetical protein
VGPGKKMEAKRDPSSAQRARLCRDDNVNRSNGNGNGNGNGNSNGNGSGNSNGKR